MKAKQIAVIIMTATMALGTAGATSVLAETTFTNNGPEFGSFDGQAPTEMPGFDNGQMPAGEAQDINGQMPSGEAPAMPDFSNWQMPGGEAPTDEAPAMPEFENGQTPTGETPSMPEFENGQAPEDMQQNGKGRNGHRDNGSHNVVKVTSVTGSDITVEIRNFVAPADDGSSTQTSDAETKTITLPSGVTVYKQSGRNEKTESSIADITSDTMLEIEYDTDGTTVKSVTIKDRPDGMGRPDAATGATTADGSNAGSTTAA